MSTPALHEQVRITAAEAIPLAYALTARVANDHGVRLLGIKGVVLAHHGLRDPRVSADIDMLLHPDDRDLFVRAMEAVGWHVAAETDTPKLLEFHSVDLLNDHWPIGVDLHVYFPGFLAPAGEVFEVLWERRIVLEQAGHLVHFTDLASSAAVAALHHLRHAWRPESQAALERLAVKASERLDAADREDLVSLAQATGAVRTLEPFLSQLGIRGAMATHPAEETEWEQWALGTQAHPHLAWWVRLRRLKPWQWPGFLWYAVMLHPDELRAYHGDHTETTPLWRLRLQRIRRVARALPNTLRHELSRRRDRRR